MIGYWMKLTQLLNHLRLISPDVYRKSSQFCFSRNNGCYSIDWEINWTWNILWKTKAAPKAACFGWLAAKEGLSNPSSIIEMSLFTLCGDSLETSNHLLLHCKFNLQIRSFLLNIFGVFLDDAPRCEKSTILLVGRKD